MNQINQRFSSHVESSLRLAGWHPDRRLHDSILKQWYVLRWPLISSDSRSVLHPIFPVAMQVMREFGGLKISRMDLDPTRAILEADYSSWIYYQWRINDQLFPLAYYDSRGELMIYAIGLHGKVYGLCGISGAFYLVGETFDQALENLILNHHMRLLFESYEQVEDAETVAAAIRSFFNS